MARSAAEVSDRHGDATLTGISQLDFRRLIENTADGVLVVSLLGTVLYANPAAAAIFGCPVADLVHIPLGRPVISGETMEITVHRPDRAPADVEMRTVELSWDGKPALLASLRDVSAQRARQEHRRQSQKLEAIGRLAAGIVHDMNNLLAVFESGLRLLQKQLREDPANPNASMLIEELLKRTQNGGALTQQLLAFSRGQSLRPQTIDLNGRIEAMTMLLERTLGNGISINLELDPALGPVVVDANQLDVAILNLAVNAKDAMAGTGTLAIETSDTPGDIEEVPALAASFVRVTVSDTGCGMSKEIMTQVFEPFFTTKADGRGTGLGLSQVYGFIKQSGGHIRIESEVGEGTSIHLFLPRAPNTGNDPLRRQDETGLNTAPAMAHRIRRG
ncbi:PAS domain-containing protein [Mesorhizobium sp. AD1-1]|uniref:two-component system sensor histidine kinase NtrB n=1 Tax=Mesorhizobium sp. AD1-1 TaxID=2876621 RepID=UPI001CC973A5|nr:ATP-binding protein [Mesorhizobium sp. AD1-1]MBZ9717528.1 PAS domain-containing protein [Mesorhizobium sp. AD1-1]